MPVVPDHPAAGAASAEQGVTFIRRMVNETTYELAIREGLDDDTPLEFLCECGDQDCDEQVAMALADFDRSSPAGAVVAHD